jgi:hypothetical protein
MVQQISNGIIPDTSQSAQGAVMSELDGLRQMYVDLLAENAKLKTENGRLRRIIEHAGLDLPESLRQVEVVECDVQESGRSDVQEDARAVLWRYAPRLWFSCLQVAGDEIVVRRGEANYPVIAAAPGRKAVFKMADGQYGDLDLTEEEMVYVQRACYERVMARGLEGQSVSLPGQAELAALDRQQMECRFMALGAAFQYHRLINYNVQPGAESWRRFMLGVDDETLADAIVNTEAFYQNWMGYIEATDLKKAERRIKELESLRQVAEVQGQTELVDLPQESASVCASDEPALRGWEQEATERQAELETLQLNYETARERLDREEGRNMELQAAREYARKLFALDNQIISGAQKLVMVAVRDYILSLRHPDIALGLFVEVPLWEIARSTGLSTDTVGSSLKRLHAVGLVERDERKERLKNGRTHTHIWVALTLLSYNPESLVIPDDKRRGHGGDTRYCKICGSIHLVKRKRVEIVCRDCGSLQEPPEETEEAVNPPDPSEGVSAPESSDVLEPGSLDVQESGRLDAQRPISGSGEVVSQGASCGLVVDRPAMPVATCALCERDYQKSVSAWIWRSDEDEWCCPSCYSPFSWSVRERERQCQAELEKEGGDKWKPPF